MAETQTRARERERRLPDIDAEDELDVGRYWNALAERWWLPVLGLIGGIIVGYLLSVGGKQVYQAKATIYPGQPLSIVGTTQIQSLSTNPSAVRQVVTSPYAQEIAERAAGLRPGSLRGHVTSAAVTGATVTSRLTGQSQLVTITVDGAQRRKIAIAANTLAKIATQRISAGYVAQKIATLKAQLASVNESLHSLDVLIRQYRASASSAGLSPTDKLIIASQLNGAAQQRSQIVDQQVNTKQLLTLAQTVEQSSVLTPARSVKATARSRRNSALVGAAIGLLLGILAALLWEPAARRWRTAP
jgi:capsular polysaccharide biosynthesis protein